LTWEYFLSARFYTGFYSILFLPGLPDVELSSHVAFPLHIWLRSVPRCIIHWIRRCFFLTLTILSVYFHLVVFHGDMSICFISLMLNTLSRQRVWHCVR